VRSAAVCEEESLDSEKLSSAQTMLQRRNELGRYENPF
jgi:hypothetical protein